MSGITSLATTITVGILLIVVTVYLLSIVDTPFEDEGMGSSYPITYGDYLDRSRSGKDLGGSSYGPYYHITWPPEEAPLEPIIDSMIERMEFMQTTTSGSLDNQKKLFELVDLKRKLSQTMESTDE